MDPNVTLVLINAALRAKKLLYFISSALQVKQMQMMIVIKLKSRETALFSKAIFPGLKNEM